MISDRSLVIWSRRTNERRVWHSFSMSNIARMDFTVSSTELRVRESVGVVGWDAPWVHILCGLGGDVCGLKAGKRACLNWTAGVVGFAMCACSLCKKLSCWYEGLSVKLAGWAPPQLTHFGGVPIFFFNSRFACCWSHLTHQGGLPQKLDEWPEDWQLKHWRQAGVLVLLPSYDVET